MEEEAKVEVFLSLVLIQQALDKLFRAFFL
jgi:hypothetical protein